MSAISDIREKDLSQWTNAEKCFVELWEQMGFEDMAEQAAAELAAMTVHIAKLEKLLSRVDVAFRCNLAQPEANDYYWKVRQDVTEALK